jgi:putative flippase GtrA
MIVLIPSFEPGPTLVALVEALVADHDVNDAALHVVVVNDGSGPAYDRYFRAIQSTECTVIEHHPNRGKGYALKAGFSFIRQRFPGHDVVCADSDGQHRVNDILHVGRAVAERANTMVLGSRAFSGEVPRKSRFGNTLTRMVFKVSTGRSIFDTQTGLRAYPASLLPWLLSIEGNRFEYETSVLLQATADGVVIEELPIETVYVEGNASTHFRPLVDSARVYAPLIKFSLSSLIAFAIDFALLVTLNSLTGNLLASVVLARAMSSTFNFMTNRHVVFGRARSVSAAAARYFPLVVLIMLANYGLLAGLHRGLHMALAPAKLVTELLLFGASYVAQKRFVFAFASNNRSPIEVQRPHEPGHATGSHHSHRKDAGAST